MSQKISAYSPEQIAQYLEKIDVPVRFESSNPSPKHDLEYLTTLQKHTLSAIPLENLALNYHTHAEASLDPEVLLERSKRGLVNLPKIVQIWLTNLIPRMGGYCMQNNHLMELVLRGLDFNVC